MVNLEIRLLGELAILCASTSGGKALIEALMDPKIQDIVWKRHGLRSGIDNDPADQKPARVPATIESVMPLPKVEVMDQIVNNLP